MVTQFELIDPPELIEFKLYQVEDGESRQLYCPFVHFLWNNVDTWLLGRMLWRNRMASGDVYLRRPKGKRLFVTKMMVHPNQATISFTVNRPRERVSKLSEAFVFMGFSLKSVVNIDFVREEQQRIAAIPTAKIDGEESKMLRPPTGLIV